MMFESLSATVVTAFATLLGVRIAVSRADKGHVARAESRRDSVDLPAYPVLTVLDGPKSRSSDEIEMMPLMERPEIKRVVTSREAAKILLAAVQDKKTRVYAASEIDDFWCMVRDQHGLADLPCGAVRAALQAIPDVFIGRKQLSLEYPDVKVRTGQSRATLYRVPGKSRTTARPASRAPGRPLAGHSMTGHCPGDGEIISNYEVAA